MPVTHTRPNWAAQIARASEDDLDRIETACLSFLQDNDEYGFTASELAARIDEPAAASVIEHALSEADEEDVTYLTVDGKLYWYAL